MKRLRYRQLFLFLVVLILPTVAIGWQGWRLVNQERDLDRSHAEKQAEDLKKSIAAEIGHDLFERLERIKFQEMANSPAAVPQPGKYSDPAAVVLIGGIDGEKLVWPWDEDSSSRALRPADDPEFDQKMRDAGRVESNEKNYDRAAFLYRSLADTAKNEAQRAEARVYLARVLRQNGSQTEAAAILRDVLNLPWNITDPNGFSWASYAASMLTKLNASGDVLNRVRRDLESPGALRSKQAEQLTSVLETLNATNERAIRDEVTPALEQLASRMRNLEQARSLKEARDLQRDFAHLHVTLSDWKPYTGAENELWLVGRTPRGSAPTPLAVVVRAEAIRKSVENSRVALGGTKFQIVAGGDTGKPAGEQLRELRIELPDEAFATAASDSGLRQRFYGLSLFVVVPLTFLGGYLLWRDTRRESRVAEMRSQFVSSVSHELKTPLTSIRMFAETLQMADETNSSDVKVRTEYLDTIVSESERLTRLLNNVLDFSRIERDQKTYHMEAADLPEVMDAAVKTMRFPLSEQGFDLHVDIADDVPSLHIDRDAIEQAVLNLLSNAMKYSGKSRDIELKLSRQNGCALIQVSDHGIGIAPAEQRRIFDRFYRVNSGENRAISGTGLGLALVAHIAEAHKGRVEVESKVGEGKYVLDSDSGQREQRIMSLVLIVEDDPSILRGLTDNLRTQRYEVAVATDGETGYRLAVEKKPDLVILDVMLPNMSGLEICKKLRGEGFSGPILMLTARGDESDRVLGLDLGADDYVTKPFSIRELLARVRALLRRTQNGETLPDEVRFDDVVVDFRRFEALKRGVSLELTRKEFGVLRALAAKAGHVVTRDDLLNDVWGYESYPSTRTVDTHIGSLRAKLEDEASAPRRLITVHGVGYKLLLS